jgi:rhodanese-related sulfurtransferase
MNKNRNNRHNKDKNQAMIRTETIDTNRNNPLAEKSIRGLLFLAAVLILVLILSSCAQNDSPADQTSYPETTAGSVRDLISPEDARQLLESDSGALLLDVRTEAEHIELRIPGSMLIPVGELESRLNEISDWKEKTIIVYCRSGNRSSQAADILQENGFMTIYDLGGIGDWPYETESGSLNN